MNNATEEQWFLNESRKYVQSDIFQARSWLLTAKCMFPLSFDVQLREYQLELSNKNSEDCAKALNEIFRDFPSETKLWEEIELLIEAVEKSDDATREEIFGKLPSLTQQRMIISSAERRVNITQYCRLIILLMKKFPETTSEYGVSLAEKLVETEKRDSDSTPVNHCRKLLVREVLPAICRSGNVGVSHRHFYKWLQKSTEFYATYFSTPTESGNRESWDELEELRSAMAGYCEWTKDPSNGNTLVERGNFMKELFRRSRTDVEDTINRKQIFYSTIILLLEAASKHMLLVEPHIYEERDDSSSYIVIEDIDTEVSTVIESPVKQSQELRETFHVAKDAWMVLHTNETFEKDFHHLARRWKCERWYWLQLFLIQLQTFNGNYKAVLSRLASLQLKSDAMQSNVILQRICTHLVSTHFALGQLNESCRFIFQSVPLFPTDPTTPKVGHVTRISPLTEVGKPAFELAIPGTPTQRKLKLENLKFDNLIAYWVQILITSLRLRSQNVENDHILGHLFVLCQHDWPKWKGDADKVLQKIEEKQSFSFDIFYTYIINIALLEEIAYLKKRKGCQMNFGSNLQTKVHVTRGANREVEDDFWSSMKRNVQRSDESVNLLLRDYLITCQESIASSLAMLET